MRISSANAISYQPRPADAMKQEVDAEQSAQDIDAVAMPYDQLPALMARLADTPGTASKALQYTILSACRTSEVLHMTWDEIDLDNAVWNIKASG
jgi:integrase